MRWRIKCGFLSRASLFCQRLINQLPQIARSNSQLHRPLRWNLLLPGWAAPLRKNSRCFARVSTNLRISLTLSPLRAATTNFLVAQSQGCENARNTKVGYSHSKRYFQPIEAAPVTSNKNHSMLTAPMEKLSYVNGCSTVCPKDPYTAFLVPWCRQERATFIARWVQFVEHGIWEAKCTEGMIVTDNACLTCASDILLEPQLIS